MDKSIQYLINHSFIPPELPQENDYGEEAERKLCQQWQRQPDYEMYERLCAFLGLYTPSCQSTSDFPIQIDGFIKPQHRAGLPPSTFKKSPVPFLKEFVSLRQKGMGFSLTHMGRILLGRSLTKEDFNN
jgi:hypothetical protein